MNRITCIHLVFMKCVLMLLLSTSLLAQDSLHHGFRAILQLNTSLSFARVERSIHADKADYSQSGLSGTVRALWRPDHLLAIGIETGFLRVSKLFVKEDATLPSGSSIGLGAIPVLAIFSMEKYGVEVSAGVGSYDYMVHATVNGIETKSDEWEVGWSIGFCYSYQLSRSWLIGASVRHYAIPERSVSVTTAGMQLQWQWWY